MQIFNEKETKELRKDVEKRQLAIDSLAYVAEWLKDQPKMWHEGNKDKAIFVIKGGKLTGRGRIVKLTMEIIDESELK